MKTIYCGYEKCGLVHRPHTWDNEVPDPPHRNWEVPDDYFANVYCSITCACYAGVYNVTKDWLNDEENIVL